MWYNMQVCSVQHGAISVVCTVLLTSVGQNLMLSYYGLLNHIQTTEEYGALIIGMEQPKCSEKILPLCNLYTENPTQTYF